MNEISAAYELTFRGALHRWLVISSICFVWLVGSLAAQDSAQAPADPGAQDNTLASGQTQLATRFKKLEGILLRSAEIEAVSNPTRAELMRKAAALAKQVQLSDSLVRAARSLEQKQYSQAIEDQKASLENLNKILELLQSENRTDRVREQRDQIRRTIEETERLLRLQSSLRGRTEGGSQTDKAASDQQKLAEKAAQIAKDLNPDAPESKDSDKASKANDKDKDGTSQDKKSNAEDGQQSDEKKPSDGDSSSDKNKSDGKPSDKQDGKQDGKPSDKQDDKQDGKPSDKQGDQKNGDDKKTDEPKSGDSKSSDGKKSDKPSEGQDKSKDPSNQAQEGQPADKPADQQSKSDQQPPSPGKPSQNKPSQNKPGQQQQSQPSDDSQQSSGEQSESGESEQKPESKNPTDRAAQRLKKAQKQMEEAQKNLQEAKREGAVEKQRQAEQELKTAIEELEEILRQLREEEIERSLSALEERLRLMLQLQNKVLDESKRLQQIGAGGNDRQVEIRANGLAADEKKILGEAQARAAAFARRRH